ncbi:hypothetical protein ZIOFF_032336 [Zingiber officinale]|uniref:Protein SirB1 N-terminal domain-containing protein n=1 Tax=Zingiber officinale TaxID=94328 RepID=A0A8J5GIV9_ZINOF|nr:hypothetical protein ZIOFF_032336 [Zingiber officinale]
MASFLGARVLSFPFDAAHRRDGRLPFYPNLRFGFDRRLGNGKKTRHVGSPPPSVASPTMKRDSLPDPNIKILKIARENFAQEISVRSDDKDVSLAKALLLVAAEDEAFMSLNHDMDAQSVRNEREVATDQFSGQLEVDCVEDMSLAGKSISGWLNELDVIAKQVEAELISRDIGCHLLEILEAVNFVLFESRSFKRFPVLVDSKFSYLHTVLSTGCGSNIMFSVIYVEVCQRLGVNIVGSKVGEDFLIWPQSGNSAVRFSLFVYLKTTKFILHLFEVSILAWFPCQKLNLRPKELFSIASGRSLFATINGKCVKDPRSMASEMDSTSVSRLDIATKRDIIGIALANLIRFYWKRASKANHGLMLTSPLKPVYPGNDKAGMGGILNIPLLRPQDLSSLKITIILGTSQEASLATDCSPQIIRLAIMASERLLILQPGNWTLRRDHGMLLYYSRRYAEAVQELSICMAFAPEEEAEILEPFVEKLHLLRLLSSWECLDQFGSVPIS